MSKKNVPVSVVVPCFRCEYTIERAVSSVFRQTVLPSEIILIDDCSPDDTARVLRSLQEQHGNDLIRVISLSENSGPSVARNAGWEMSRYPYIAFLDADDSWHPKKLEIQYDWMMGNQDFCMSGHASEPVTDDFIAADEWESAVGAREISSGSLFLSNVFPTRSVMLKRNVRARFKPEKRHSEDYLLWLRIILCEGRGAFLSPTLAYSYKENYGAAGLSGDLWKMQKGEISTFSELHREGMMNLFEFSFFSVWSWLKFGRRLVVANLRK